MTGRLGVLHTFSGDLSMAKQAMDLGFYISISGPVTYKNARQLPSLVKVLPLDRLLVETDAPFLATIGIPTYGIGAYFLEPDLGHIHGLNERIRVDSLYDARDFLYALVNRLANAPDPIP